MSGIWAGWMVPSVEFIIPHRAVLIKRVFPAGSEQAKP